MLRQTARLINPVRALTPVPRTLTSPFRQLGRAFAQITEKVPPLGDSISEGTIVRWEKKPGDAVKADDVICVLETDKVSVDIRATQSGKLLAVAAKEGQTVAVGAPLATLDTDANAPVPPAAPASAPASPKASAPAPPQTPSAPTAPAAPAPRAAPAPTPAPAPAAPKAAPSPAAPSPAAPKAAAPGPVLSVPVVKGSRTERVVPLTRMRLTIAKRLKDAQNTAAMLTTFNEVDMSVLMELRNKYKDDFEKKHGVKLGFMSAFVKAASHALQAHPAVNAFFDLDKAAIVYRDYVDISVAVATPTGLVVPVLRNCENMKFHEVEQSIAAYGQKARKGQIALEDMVGGTFTISNGGVYGSLMGTPIINPPQSAILGMHGIFKRPVVVNDKVEIRPMMYIALTYDHRIIDGADAVTFLKAIKNAVEDPARLLLDL